ncbi:hypothetical protein A1QO_00840 [Vibrio genomosp. F10 str. ZF-129]|uniref:Uncharacterized protein n=1 Tax=Vibrio genomosp. F10 str. ZF-129 TaxID=1187848 RepID=A0A1E5BGD3_9VIBR|nr:AcaB family transcriptional regulator [Vibrio genomosp. F10]OEE35339.1 hypothetical protein A1QO_00840 [Vibrio genomosp. F10 str. ZF-129]
MNKQLNFLDSLLQQQKNSGSSLLSAVDNANAIGRSRSRDDLTHATSHEYDFMNETALRLFDGLNVGDSVRKIFIPGYHHLDNAIAGQIRPAYFNGCPIARWQILAIEKKISAIKELATHEHNIATGMITEFLEQNEGHSIQENPNATRVVRSLSFKSPHLKDLMTCMKQIEKTFVLMDSLSTMNPIDKQKYREVNKGLGAEVRSLLHMQSQYKNTGANAVDFEEYNKKAIDALAANSNVALPEDFMQSFVVNDTTQSIFFEGYNTAEKIRKEKDAIFDQAMVTSEQEENDALQERSDLDAISKSAPEEV